LQGWWQALVLWSRKKIIEYWERREARQAVRAERRAAEEAEEAAAAAWEPDSEDSVSSAEPPVSDIPEQKERIVNSVGERPKSSPKIVPEPKEVQKVQEAKYHAAAASIESAATPEAQHSNSASPFVTPADIAIPATPSQNPEAGLRNPIPESPVPQPGQPLLKVRPAAKQDAGIPRITRNGQERLGSRSMHFSRLTNGAIAPEEDRSKSVPVSAVTLLAKPAAASPEINAMVTSAAPALAETEMMTSAVEVTPIAGESGLDNIDRSEAVIEPLKPRSKEPKAAIPPPVTLGDEKVLSNEALPHSVSTDSGLPVPRLSEQKAAASAAEDLFHEEGEKPVIPENPYLEMLSKYRIPPLELLTPADPKDALDANDEELAKKGRLLRDKLATFGVDIENITVTPVPVVTLYEFTPAEGIKVSRVENLTDDIALAMKARGIRIIAPIPGRGTIGVEIPNDVAEIARIRSLFESESFRNTKMNLPLALGKTISGDVYVDDLNKMPHLLIAGATGSGKSVGVNGIIASLLYAKSPRDIKFVIIDPKKIELSLYKKLRKHYLIVSPEAGEDIVTTPMFAVLALKAVELEMERRYDKLAKAAVRSLADYNIKVAQGKLRSTQEEQHYHLPYIVVIIDELADLMITAAREIEEPICRIAQMARAVGIHLILATQ